MFPPARTTLIALSLSACLAYSINFNCALAKDKFVFQSMVPKLDPLPARKVLRGSVAESTLVAPPPTNVFGYAEQGSRYPTKVTYVAPNSVAWLGGLQAGDHVLNGRIKPEKAILIVQRGGKKYACVLNANAMSTEVANTKGDESKKLSSKVEQSDTRALTSYAIAMVVDNSASMGTKDCPGDISRWQWCKDHISELYSQDNGVLQKNISIVTFDSNFHSRQNCSPGDLQSVFSSGNPTGETNMAPALEEAFLLVRSQLNIGKPAIVTVVSDGRPSDVENVKKTIIRQANALPRPKLLSIVFIEVGTPEHYLQELDNDLVKQGAAADIVKVIPFTSASSQNLSKTLASTLPKPILDTTRSAAPGSASSAANSAKAAVASHIYTYVASPPVSSAGSATSPAVEKRAAAAAVAPRPQVVAAPPIKAHPAGTAADGDRSTGGAASKPVEVDEKAAVLRNSANRTYK